MVGQENLIITNLKETDLDKLKNFAEVKTESIANMKQKLDNDKTCVLDPAAKDVLSPKDNGFFEYIILGGILGDDPPKTRTQDEIRLDKSARRHLGKDQFPTDNAAFVCREILAGTPIEEMEFTKDLEIEIEEGESIVLPFKYVMIDGQPLVSKEVIEILKKEYGFD
jgi:ribosome biogenesis SPOUT family RNA methylase Rps3